MSALDLNLLPLVRQNGQDQADLPGLYAVTPPQRAARGRSNDKLILYLQVIGGAPLPPEQYNQLLVRLAQMYFKASGTVTAALRATAEALNQVLLERNLRSSNSGRQGVGLLAQVVVRDDVIYLAMSSPGHAFLIRPQSNQHFYDPQGAGRGLGLSRTTTIRYFQVSLQPNDFLLLAHQPAEAWLGENGPAVPGQGMEGMRRRLFQQVGAELNAVLIQAQSGTGRMRLLRLKPAFQDMARPAAMPGEKPVEHPVSEAPTPEAPGTEGPGESETDNTSPEVGQDPSVLAGGPLSPSPRDLLMEAQQGQSGVSLQPVEASQASQMRPMDQVAPSIKPAAPGIQPEPSATQTAREAAGTASPPVQAPSKPIPTGRKRRQPRSQPGFGRFFSILLKALQVFGAAFGNAIRQVFEGLRGLLRRILPDETLLNVSPTTMVFFALAIPLVISVVGGMVYIERGQGQQYQALYRQAFQAAEEAKSKTNPAEQRAAWQKTLDTLDQTELYQVTEQSQTLRTQARGQLDQLDAIERLDFQPALLRSLDKTDQIIRMEATTNELYLLNATQGNILRAMLTATGYDLDPKFLCGPAAFPGSIGPLVDLAVLPAGQPDGATVLGVDLNGNLLYCVPGADPNLVVLAPPPVNFENPKAIALDSGDLYLIDPPKKSVWVYRNMVLDQPPNQFLGDITSFMVDVVDITVNSNDVYLLHSNGRMTKCTYSGIEEVPTRCEDPLIYTDPRPGRTGGEFISDALFNQILFAPPPDPSLYLLDPRNQAIYHFSLRLTLDRQYRSLRQLPARPATAFAVSPTRMMFIAIGNSVYYAALP